MNMLLKGMLTVFWLIFMPEAVGCIFLKKGKEYGAGERFIAGYLFMFALMELLALPMLYIKLPLHILVWTYGIMTGIAAVIGIVFFIKDQIKTIGKQLRDIKNTSFWLWFGILLILFQIVILVRFAHMDADDSFYVGSATTAVYTDTIFSVNPYTGADYVTLPSRYVLSPFPVFLAVISILSGGLHPAIIAHTIFPAVFLMLTYVVLHQIGKKWFPESREAQGIFLAFTAVLSWFSAYSVYNSGNFQMIRIWQGKGLLAAAFLPLLFYLGIRFFMEKEQKYPWIWLFLANTSCCLLTSMGIILAPLVTGVFIFWSLFRKGRGKRTLWGILCCLPCIILGIINILIR